MASGMAIEVVQDRERLAERAVEHIVAAASAAIDERGRFVWAVSGGSTPRRMLELLSQRRDLDWSRSHLFQVDERVAPNGHPDRNASMLETALLTEQFREHNKPAGIWLMPVTEPNLEAAAARYEATMMEVAGSPAVFDLVQLGMGADGHTASLIPDDPILDVVDREVALSGEYQGRVRMSFTWPVLDRATCLLWVIGGTAKQPAVRQFLDNDAAIPATLPTQARSIVVLDQAANG